MRAGTTGGRGRQRLALLCATAACAVAAPGALALGSERGTAPSTVTISSRVPAFSGKVKSGNGACEAGRRVQLFRRSGDSGGRVIGRDRSSSSGRWKTPVDPLQPGAYYAKVKRSRAGSSTCRGARSEVVVVD